MSAALNDQNIGLTLTAELPPDLPTKPLQSLNCKDCEEDFSDEESLHAHLLSHVKQPFIVVPRVPSTEPPIKITLKTRNNSFEIVSSTETTEVSNGDGRETRRRRGRRKHINYCEDYDFDDSSQNSDEGSAATGGEETSQDVPDSVRAVEKAADIAEEFGAVPFEESKDAENNDGGGEQEKKSADSTMTPAAEETQVEDVEVIEEIHNPEVSPVPKLRIVQSQFLFNKSSSENFAGMVESNTTKGDNQQSPAYPSQSPSQSEQDRPVWNTPSLEDPLRLPEPDKDVGNLLQTLFNNNDSSNNAVAIPSTETEYISLERLGERNKQLQVYNSNNQVTTNNALDNIAGLPMQQLAQQVSRLNSSGMHQQNVLINIQQFPSAPQPPPPQYPPVPPMHHYQGPPAQHPGMYHQPYQPYQPGPNQPPNYPYYPPAYPQMPPQQPPPTYRPQMPPPPGPQMQSRMPMQPPQQGQQHPRQPMQQQQQHPRQPMQQQQGQPRMANGPRMQQQQTRMAGPRGQQPILPRPATAVRQRAPPMMRAPMPRGPAPRMTRAQAPRPGQLAQQRPLIKRPGEQHQQQQNVAMKRKRMDMLIPDKHDDADCQVISMQPPANEGLPVIQNVQGGATMEPSDPANIVHLTDSITLSVRNPTQNNAPPPAQKKSDAKAVANILATRGITVTAAAKPKETGNGNSSRQGSVSPPSVAINLNGSVSIIPSAKTHNNNKPQTATSNKTPTVDLTDDSDAPSPPPPATHPPPQQAQKQSSPSTQQQSNQRGSALPFRCDLCVAQYPTALGLSKHRQTYHKATSAQSEIGIPLIDLKQPGVLTKLSTLGIYNYIPLPGAHPDAMLGLPVVSINAARSPSVCNLAGLGATSILTMGPVRSVTAITNNRQPQQRQ